ncbi:MAG: hypothetical protein IKB01_01820 [Lachnospiraceae bacterium]|nr:hypothetical protein [Lachnospiraceae bacterium]
MYSETVKIWVDKPSTIEWNSPISLDVNNRGYFVDCMIDNIVTVKIMENGVEVVMDVVFDDPHLGNEGTVLSFEDKRNAKSKKNRR